MDQLDQILLAVFGFLSIYFLSSKDIRRIRYGFLFGLIAEPLWFYTAWKHGQWAVMFLVICYALCHIRGFYYAVKRDREDPKLY